MDIITLVYHTNNAHFAIELRAVINDCEMRYEKNIIKAITKLPEDSFGHIGNDHMCEQEIGIIRKEYIKQYYEDLLTLYYKCDDVDNFKIPEYLKYHYAMTQWQYENNDTEYSETDYSEYIDTSESD